MEVVVTTGAIRCSSQIVTTNKPTPNFFTDRMPFLSPNQQCQSTEGTSRSIILYFLNLSVAVNYMTLLAKKSHSYHLQK